MAPGAGTEARRYAVTARPELRAPAVTAMREVPAGLALLRG
ncbi:hypothetical protein ABGB07_10595 [Micromonosporaceae bacterium B7E4]